MKEMWCDESGRKWPVPSTKQRMNFVKFAGHAALRAFIHRRDKFACQACGKRGRSSQRYDGRTARLCNDSTLLVVDHRLALRHGGTNHPENLQILCDPCNALEGDYA